jgi:predicted nucleotidyltransferase
MRALLLKEQDTQLKAVFSHFPQIILVLLFGSLATGRTHAESDIDIAVMGKRTLTAEEKISLIQAIAAQAGRAVDLIDLRVAGEPLLGQIVKHGKRILGSDTVYGELMSRHLFEQADFLPYRIRLLKERRIAWIGM